MSGPTDPETTDSSLSPSRRSVLRAIGIGGGVAMLGGMASASPGNRGGNGADPKAACGECAEGYTYTKIDGAPEVGEEYDLGGVVVTITDVKTKDDGEVYAFKYETTRAIDKVCVKGGRPTQVYVSGQDFTGNGSEQWFYAPLNDSSPQEGDYYQVSNVAFCHAEGLVGFQADFVTGYPLADFGDSSYTGEGRRLNSITFAVSPAVAAAASAQSITEDDSSAYEGKRDCFDPDWAFIDADDSGTVTLEWDGTISCPEGSEEMPVSLVIYQLPAPGQIYPLSAQTLVACDTKMVDSNTSSIDFSLNIGDGC